MYEKSKSGTWNILMTKDQENKKRVPKSDWQSFFYSMCHFYGVRINWLGFGTNPKEDLHRIMVSAIFLFFPENNLFIS